ncbi:hypothetical protein [Halalkalicoccus salilacus]|uniref:hypothetical protein n=1 Tax=Halalkalicoccus salilacus TaxID=3117459 RepID=UPI00300E7775
MATSLADLTPSTGRRHAGNCLACGLVMGFGWIALLFGTHLFVTDYLPDLDPQLLALSGGWTVLGTTLLLVSCVRAYNVLFRPY